MGDLLIRNIPDALKKNLAESAERSGLSLSEQAKELLRQGLVGENGGAAPEAGSAFESLRSAFKDILMTDEEHADFMAAIDESRRHEAARQGYDPE